MVSLTPSQMCVFSQVPVVSKLCVYNFVDVCVCNGVHACVILIWVLFISFLHRGVQFVPSNNVPLAFTGSVLM